MVDETVRGCLAAIGYWLLVTAVAIPLVGWALMLLLGVLHHEVSSAVPALGFWPCAAIMLLGRSVVAGVTPQRHQRGGGRG